MGSPTEPQMKAALQAYIDALNGGDLEGVLSLYAEDAIVEDPVGSPLRTGRSEIMAMYQQALATGFKLQLVAPIRASHGDAAAMAFECTGPMTVRIIDVMRFNPDGKIRSMQAFWGASDMDPLPRP